MDTTDLDQQIECLADLVAADRPDWREVWALVREINQGFRAIRYPQPAERRSAWSRFQAVAQTVKTRQATELAAGEGARRDLDERLTYLEREVARAMQGAVSWRLVWDEIKSLRSTIKQARFPSTSDRETAWQRLNAVADQAQTHRERKRQPRAVLRMTNS